MTQHIHHDLIVQWAKDTTQVVEYLELTSGEWFIEHLPNWYPEDLYRIRHKHQDLIDQKAARPELIVQIMCDGKWLTLVGPNWDSMYEYRLVEPRHKHQDLIDRKKERPELIVEIKDGLDNWVLLDDEPRWYPDNEYRIVEPAKKKVKMWQWVMLSARDVIFTTAGFHKDEASACVACNTSKPIQRADWTEIEVEE